MVNYIDDLACKIYILSEGRPVAVDDDLTLYRIYAVLALAKGEDTTAEDVHNAWAAWTAGNRPRHRSLVPFSELSPEVQALDEPYVQAIRRAATTEAEA